jgi:DNA mismatch repair protein MutL
MLRTIHVLDDHVANQIAAGEVVERPSSVVKELIENSLDAGATKIQILIEDGGKTLIRIVDNGCGMNSIDALMSLKRHATSKVFDACDLQTIATLGFRGEALPSIRSVARFQLRTRTHDTVEGTQITADGGEEPVLEPVGCPPGTDVSVRELFFNVPARRKFLKRESTEMQRISELVNQLALGWPGVHFRLQHNGRKVSDYPKNSGLNDRIRAVLGKKVHQQLIAVKMQLGDCEVAGYTSTASFNRRNNRGIYTFINGRFVRDRVLQHAVTQAYGLLLERGHYPVCVLYINLPLEALDINVHPAKAEVRFVESSAVHSLVERALKLSLADSPNVLSMDKGNAHFGELFLPSSPNPNTRGEGPPAHTEENLLPTDNALQDGGIEYIGQLANRFWVCKNQSALLLIDQHAFSQQIQFMKLNAQWGKGAIVSQRLLFPARTSLSQIQAATLESCREKLHMLGFEIEHFGGQDWVVSTLPASLAESGREAIAPLVDLLNQWASCDSQINVQQALATIACHGAWRAGEFIPAEEATTALRNLGACHSSSNCTHSRAVMTQISSAEIESWLEVT